MKRVKEHDEQIGYFTFVQNNDSTDYLKLAYACGLSLKATQNINKFAIAVDKPTKEQLQALKSKGFKWENGKIKKSTIKDILSLQDPKKSPMQSPQNKKIAERFAKSALKERKVSDLGRLGNQALKRGSKGFMGKLATNKALQAALGGGNLLTRAFAGGRMGAVAGGPWGAIIGSIALPMVGGYVWDQIKESQPTSDKTSIWK